MIRNLLALTHVLLLPGWLWGQSPNLEDQLGKITIPSATVSSLLKFTDVPVSYYTGTPDISVPIYTINTGKLSLPIVLRYGASGVRVAQNASNVGLDWSLSAEGVLQETVFGIPDNNSYHQNGLGWDNAALQSTDPTDQALLESLSTRGQDGAPDLYTCSFAGYSGKFIYADVIRTLPQQNLAISSYMNASSQPEWKIVTQDGAQYFFGIIEHTANRSAESITRSRTWYLTKIKDANNTDSITLAYEPTIVTEVIGRSYFFYAWRPNAPQPLPFDKDMAPNDPAIPGQFGQIEQISHSWQLKTITWNQGSIEYDFVTGDREDMTTGSPRVKNIFLKDKDGATIRVVHFDHSYFLTPNVNDMNGKRLKLDAVTFAPDLNSLNAPTAHKYAFEYDPLALPSKLSNRVDHWGFYNGAFINDSRGLIPSFTYPGMHYYGANRDANPAFTKAAMLTKMYYPTGGYAAFTWDVHAKTYPTQLLDSIIVYQDSLIEMEMMCEGSEELLGEFEDHIAIPTAPTDLFGNGVAATWSIKMNSGGQNTYDAVTHAAGGGWLMERPIGTQISVPGTIKASKTFNYSASNPYVHQQNVTLLPGKYYGNKGHLNWPGFQLDIALKAKWPRKVANTYTPPSDFLGGCRIRKIELFDTFTRKSIVKNYYYSLPSFIAVPEYHQPLFRYYFYNNGNPPSGNAGDCMYNIPIEGMYVSSNSVHNFNAGVQAGYDWVVEAIGNGGGSTAYKFTNFNELSNHGEFPASWRYGRLREKTEMASNSGEVRKTTYGNRITINPAENFAGHTAVRTGAHPCYSPGGIYPVHFDQKVYSFPCDWIYTDSVKTEDFLTGITTISVNGYDNPQHRELTRSTTFFSDGSKETRFIKYPTDFTFSNPPSGDAAAVARLQDKHMHNTPIEQYVQKWPPGSAQPLTIAAGYNQFKITNPPANDVAASGVYSLDINAGIANFQPAAASTNTLTKDTRYQVKATIQEYDGRYNPLSMLGEGEHKIGYIWGYDNTMPIAKVLHDSFSNKRAFTSFEQGASGGWTYNEAAVVTTDHLTGKRALNLAYGSPSPGIHIPPSDGSPYAPHQPVPGKYIVSYWKKGGTVQVPYTIASTTGMTANGWTYCEHLIENPLNYFQIGGTALIDELRFYLKDAQVESFTYDPLIGITSRDDAGSHIILYEYDAMGRLSLEKDVFGNILKKHTYQYLGDQ